MNALSLQPTTPNPRERHHHLDDSVARMTPTPVPDELDEIEPPQLAVVLAGMTRPERLAILAEVPELRAFSDYLHLALRSARKTVELKGAEPYHRGYADAVETIAKKWREKVGA